MSRWRSLGGAAVLVTGLASGGMAGTREPYSPVAPGEPGPSLPPVGRSLFDELFAGPDGHDVPYPFARLLQALDRRIAPATVRTALIPLGRSLQRYAAHPDYFGSPRLVVAVDAESAEPGALLLKDRIYLGFQPAADAIEIISYNEAAGRFEFQEIVDYGSPRADVRYASREVCVPCHQGHGPIFARPLWSESNADPQVADALSGLGTRYHGAPVRQGIDALDDFDRSTDRANRLAVINLLWERGCGAGPEGERCRIALLREALRYRLTGARTEWLPDPAPEVAGRLHDRLADLWPGGLATPSPDLVNRAPLKEAAVTGLDKILETEGLANPQIPRPLLQQWSLPDTPAETLGGLAREIGALFTASDIAWLDAQLAGFGTEPLTYRASCRDTRIDRGDERTELRFQCGEKAGELQLAGFVVLRGASVEDARIESITIGKAGNVRRLRLADGMVAEDRYPKVIRLALREGGAGLAARLLTGRRILELSIRGYGSQAIVRVETIEDLPALDIALESLASADYPVADGPFRRHTVLAALARRFAEE